MNRIEINTLRQQRAALAQQARTILDEAGSNPLSSEQREKWDKVMADVDGMKVRIDAEERQLSLDSSLEGSIREPNKPEVRNEPQVAETRDARLANEEYKAAFREYLAGGFEGLAPEQRRLIADLRNPELRAQGVASAGIGGATVPTGFRNQLMEAMKAFGGVRTAGATVLSTDAGNTLPIPTVNETAQTGELVAENTAVTAQDATFSSVSLLAYKYSSKTILVSFELLQDSAIDITGYIAEALGTRLGRIQNTHFTTGTGSSQPQGVVTGSTSGKTAASATAITYLELIDLMHSVDPAHRGNAKFMMNDLTLAAIKKLQDTTGRPLWLPGVAVGEPDTLLGKPYVINQDMATIATAAKTVLFGDFKYYHVRDVMDVQLFRITDKYIEQGSVGFLAYLRSDGKMVNPGSNPIKYLVQA